MNGKDGLNGKDGKDGKDGQDGKNGIDGKNGVDGIDGIDGIDGKDGRGILDVIIISGGLYVMYTDDPDTYHFVGNISGDTPIIPDYPSNEIDEVTGLELSKEYDGTYSVVGIGNCTDTVLVIPDTFNGLPVTSINGWAFNNNQNLTSVHIPASVTDIYYGAFANCTNLAEVTFGENSELDYIGGSAFMGCEKLTSIDIPNGVTQIESWAFDDCSSLANISVPESVIMFGYQGFDMSILNLNEDALGYYLGNDENPYVMLMAIKDADVESIAFNAQTRIIYGLYTLEGYSCMVESIVLPDTVVALAPYAFEACYNLKSLYISAGTIYITAESFLNTNGLETIEVDEGNPYYKAIDNVLYLSVEDVSALIYYCSGKTDTSFTVPDGVIYIGESSIHNGYLEEIFISDTVTELGFGAIAYCNSLKKIHIGAGVSSLPNGFADGCYQLEEITVDPNNEYYYMSGNCLISVDGTLLRGFKTSVIPADDSVTAIAWGAFRGAQGITEIVIPDSVKEIGGYAFEDCTDLEKIVIGKGVESIDWDIFRNDDQLTEVYYTGSEEEWNEIYIDSENEVLFNLTVIFNYVPEE